jgi:alpha-methylacyl-CoA racemase
MFPLRGLLVLDLTRLLPGAKATQRLAAHGAEVVKIERPGAGDYARSMPPLVDGVGAVFLQTNGGKKSAALDLKAPGGREALLRLAAKADVLVEGFRPGVMDRLGLGWEALRAANERLIYATLTGYGPEGDWSELAGHDVNYMAMAGVLDLIGPAGGPPVIPGVQIADLAGGAMQLVIGVLLALIERERTGRGGRVDISMTAGLRDLLPVPMSRWSASGRAPERGRDVLSGRYACYNVYQARDGRWLAVGALEPKFWATLCRRLGCEDLVGDQFAEGPRRIEVIARVSDIFLRRDAAAWFAELRGDDCCVTPVLRLNEAYASPAPEGPRAPRLGEHTRETLSRAGYSDAEIDEMFRAGVAA